ncbi:hypothetical protein [Curvivirga sp.]|uniref:hypothetical protein n=1 Tax=Curvivirga sp. TaxID=2856848 RepID=UPI003B5C91D6
MHFKLIYENHWNFGLSVAETFLMLKYALENVGHRADIEKEFCPGFINVVMENFDEEFLARINDQWTDDTKLIVIATEFLTGSTFNDIYDDPEERESKRNHYQNKKLWQDRFDNFVKLAPRMSAIWHLAFQEVPIYQNIFKDIPVGYLPHIYSENFSRVTHLQDDEKDIDVFFSGAQNQYRNKILDSLRDVGLNVVMTHQMTAPFHREDLIARSKLAVNIKQNSDWAYESNSRLFYHINNDSLVLTEKCSDPSDLNKYVVTVDNNWVELVKEQLSLGHFTERAIGIRQDFAKDKTPEMIIPLLLSDSGLFE